MLVSVAIHSSQFPDQIERDLALCLRSRQVNHKFHYDSPKQTQKWLALHGVFSPSRTDPQCSAIYEEGFIRVSEQLSAEAIHLVGLGCGGGQKDRRLLHLLALLGKTLTYTPCDVSTAMVLVARQAASGVLPEERILPLVCDLATADDLVLPRTPGAARLITFFGMIPNFEPTLILPRLARLLAPTDTILFSANLAPGSDYRAGVQRILPLYENELTREWLLTFLLDLGAERNDGEVRFSVEEGEEELLRVVARFHFLRERRLQLNRETYYFKKGDSIRLFFSYRHTPERIARLLKPHGFKIREQWITPSEEEGVFWLEKTAEE